VKIKTFTPFVLALVILFTGCSEETELLNNSKEIADSKSVDLAISMDKEIAYKETYYKIGLEKVSFDESSILTYLIADFDATAVLSNNTSEGTEHSTEIDGVRHTWTTEKNTFLYYNDVNDNSSISESEALDQGSDFVEKLQFDMDENPTVKEENGTFTLEYSLQYEGTKILGNRITYMQGSNDEQEIKGEYVSVTISGGGINSVYISNLMKPTKVLKEYDAEVDFINYDKLHQVLSTYFNKIYSEFGEDISGTFSIDKMNIIYMPNMENNYPILMPVIEVEGKSKINENQDDFSIIVDAVTGYVYSS